MTFVMDSMVLSMLVVLLTYGTCTKVGLSRLPCSAVDVSAASNTTSIIAMDTRTGSNLKQVHAVIVM